MQKKRLTAIEILVLLTTAVMLIIGYVLFYTAPKAFLNYVVEDGSVEWLTVVGLMLGSITCFVRFFRLLRKRKAWFLTVVFLMGLMLFFAAGEEISWGQRILGIKSSEFFEKNNAQHETNFHNLIVDGVKMNKLVFSQLLSIAMGIFLILVPVLHYRSRPIRNFLDYSGVPVPRVYQIISFILLIIATSLLHHEKNAELLECGTGLLFFLIIRYPVNQEIFNDRRL